jgi:LysM repeat protein
MSSHRKPRLSAVRNRARTVTLCAATLGAAAVPVAAQAASTAAPSAVKPVQPPRATHPAGKPKNVKPAAGLQRATIESVSTGSGSNSPSSSTASASSSAAASTGSTYTVVSGDTLSGIAERALGNGADYPELFKLNKDRAEAGGAKFTDPNLINVGWSIELPSGAKSAVVTSPTSSTSDSSSSDDSSAPTQTEIASTSSSTLASSSSSSSSDYSDDLNGWIDEAISVLGDHGYSVSYDAVYETAMNESAGVPSAVNDSDSNAAEGNPSEGLMQTTQTTFDAYALSGYDDIWNPVDNIIAAAIYAQETYGGLDTVVSERCDGSCWYGY